jgi:hypothetical protein
MFFIRFLILFAIASAVFQTHAFAASGVTSSSANRPRAVVQDTDTETGTLLEEKRAEEKKTEKNAQKIILDVYKIQ